MDSACGSVATPWNAVEKFVWKFVNTHGHAELVKVYILMEYHQNNCGSNLVTGWH